MNDTQTVERVLPMPGQRLALVEFQRDYQEFEDTTLMDPPVDQANVITSLWDVASAVPLTDPEQVFHKVVLDIDWPVKVVPSSTPGHGHLFIDHVMSWEQYKKLMRVMAEVGILEAGYVEACIAQGSSCVRLPWIAKGQVPQ